MEELQWLWCKSVVVLFVFLSSLFLVERMFEAESKKIRREIVDTNPWQNLRWREFGLVLMNMKITIKIIKIRIKIKGF